ncbi:type III polyketide synthase, partial [Mycobacterium sp. E1319]|uniref:type III polyketide synthase n=1 Tax=Mycobacterium sp. E1319 TaxID=1834124 RepID=UPI003513C03F
VTLSRYPTLSGFTEANNAYLEVAVDLGEQAIRSALAAANIEPREVDTVVMVSSTGIAVPTIDARVMTRVGLRPDVKRVPLFGLGCVAGAAGMARVYDYLHGYPEDVAVLCSVELCSLTLQRDDTSIPALIGISLFGDGAAAVVATGSERKGLSDTAQRGPRVLATRSRVVPETVDVMGWNVGTSGFQLVMSRDVPKMADDYLRAEVDGDLEVGVVGLGEAAQRRVTRQRQREVAVVDPGRLREPGELGVGEFGELTGDFGLVVPVRGECHRGSGDAGSRATLATTLVRGRGKRCYGHAMPTSGGRSRFTGRANPFR